MACARTPEAGDVGDVGVWYEAQARLTESRTHFRMMTLLPSATRLALDGAITQQSFRGMGTTPE